MSQSRTNQMEKMLSDLILSVGTLKSYFEEERGENQKRFEQIDRRFEQMERRFEQIDERFEQVDKRFDEVLTELRSNKREHNYMASRLFRAEMELDHLKETIS